MGMKKIGRWVLNRGKEKSTWVGLGIVATLAGKPELGNHLGDVGTAVSLVVGGGLIAHAAEAAPDPKPDPNWP